MTCCNIWDKFDIEKNLIKEYEYWKLSVRNGQKTIGSCVAVTKRHFTSPAEITDDEMKEFAQIIRDIEGSLKKEWKPHTVQYMMLRWYDKHIHFHLFPRYENKINFADQEWEDNQSPDPLTMTSEKKDQNTLDQIKQKIKQNLK